MRLRNCSDLNSALSWFRYHFNEEFDPGSGRTLAARLTHASRTELYRQNSSEGRLYNLVANG